MKLYRNRHEVPGLSTTATADISFMLLVFFLVTSSMFVDKGLSRQLPPLEDDKQEQKEIVIDEHNAINLVLTATGELLVNDTLMPFNQLSSCLKEFILTRGSDHIIILDASPDCEYDAYYQLQNKLTIAYDDARAVLAQQKYGKPFYLLTMHERENVLASCPQRVAENYHLEDEE